MFTWDLVDPVRISLVFTWDLVDPVRIGSAFWYQNGSTYEGDPI